MAGPTVIFSKRRKIKTFWGEPDTPPPSTPFLRLCLKFNGRFIMEDCSACNRIPSILLLDYNSIFLSLFLIGVYPVCLVIYRGASFAQNLFLISFFLAGIYVIFASDHLLIYKKKGYITWEVYSGFLKRKCRNELRKEEISEFRVTRKFSKGQLGYDTTYQLELQSKQGESFILKESSTSQSVKDLYLELASCLEVCEVSRKDILVHNILAE